MKLTAALILAAAGLLAGCGTNKADRYQAPPEDGSVNANSADVVDNPPIVQPGARK